MKVITISGMTCSGKSHFVEQLTSNRNYERIISFTTRPPRKNEINGMHYHFVDNFVFSSLKDKNQFLEITEVGGYFYGTYIDSIYSIINKNKIPILIIDPIGVISLKESAALHDFEIYSVFLDTNFDVILERFLERVKFDIETNYVQRLKAIFVEEQFWKSCGDWDLILQNNDHSDIINNIETHFT